MLCITLWWHSLLSDEVCKLRIPYSSSSTKIHIVVCAMITASTVQKTSAARTKKKGSPAYKPKWTFFFFFREKHESLWKSLISFFLCFNRTKWNGTKLLITKNALSPPWILNCSAFRIVSYTCSSVNWYNSCIFSRTKFKQIFHNEHDKYLLLCG